MKRRPRHYKRTWVRICVKASEYAGQINGMQRVQTGETILEGRAHAEQPLTHSGTPSSDIPAEGPSSQSEDVWKAMQKDGPGTDATDTTAAKPAQEEMVRVVTKYRFAGEQMEEEKMLPASHPEAKAFLAKQAQKEPDPSATAIPSSFSANKASSAFPRSAAPAPRRKKAGGLAAMSAAATAKPTKINTLEKSKMDWTKYKDTTLGEDQRHELDAQTKGGSSGLGTMKGYMERRNFLERVQDRLEGQQREK